MKKKILTVLLTVAATCALAAADESLIFNFDFNKIQDGKVVDQSSHHEGKLLNAESCEGVDGFAIRLPGGPACVNIDLAESERQLDAMSLDLWVSPEEAAHQEIVTAASAKSNFDDLPIMLRWRQNWLLGFQVMAADGERRGMMTNQPVLEMISYPQKRTWMHIVATYDGETTALYVNGESVGKQKWNGRKAMMPIAFPVKIGGHAGLFKGAVDNFRMYRRALTAEEVKASYAERSSFKPETPPKKVAGTIDGTPYSGCGRSGNWFTVPLKRGALHLSNTGEIEVWGTSTINPRSQWDMLDPLGVSGQQGLREKFYKEVSGNVLSRRDGSALIEVNGKTVHGLAVKQTIEVSTKDEVRMRYEFAAEDPKAPAPGIVFTQHIWPSALRFVGQDDRGMITGNLSDLDGELWMRNLIEINLIMSDNRLVIQMGPDTRYHLKGTRNPSNWLNGWGNVPGEMVPSGGVKEWAVKKNAAVEFTLQLESDDLPFRLDRVKAREVTASVPFDFSRLYDHDQTRIALVPLNRDVPIFMDDETVTFDLIVPKDLQMDSKTHRWTLSDAVTDAKVLDGELVHSDPFWVWVGQIVFPAPKPGAYILKVQALDVDKKVLSEDSTELVIAGEIPQTKSKADQLPKLKKMDEADLTQDDPGHDFFSYSGKSHVTKGEKGSYRQTLTYQECRAELTRQGVSTWWANDWYGVRFKTQPGKIYVVEVEYPDLPYMSVSAYLLEPKDNPEDGKCRPIERTTSGVFTGSFLPHDNSLKTMQIVHFSSAPWVAVCWQNAHAGRPKTDQVLDPASAKRITLYEVEDDLPALDAPATADRQIGVHCESGGLALSPFGPEKFRGELGNWRDRPDIKNYYRYAYPTVANMIRYMRYRGDTTLFYGIYRYRCAQFPSRTFPPAESEWNVDLPALVARMFEKNGLKLVLNVQSNNPLPTSRLHEYTHYDIAQGANGVTSVNLNGRQDPGGHVAIPSSNPFHPAVREAYSQLAAELGEHYGKYPAVAGISWITGQTWWEPCLPMPINDQMTAEEVEKSILGATCDDETMSQFEKWAGVKLPGKAPEADRFKKRYDWIMQNAKEKFIDFRCWAMAQTHLAFQKAFVGKAPGKDYLAIDFYYDVFTGRKEWSSPLEAIRRIGFGPTHFKDKSGPIYCAYLPEANGCTYWEHSNYQWEWMPRIQKFIADDQYARALDGEGKTARYLHRQFYEQNIPLPKDRKWFWAPDVDSMATCSYPQQGDRGYLADFAFILARGTPNYICYSWCDSTIPMGHEPMHREMAAVFRNLPPGHYREADRKDGVFARVLDGKPEAFYVVNTNGDSVKVDLKPGLSGKFVDALSGETIQFAGNAQSFNLKPFECRVFLTQDKR